MLSTFTRALLCVSFLTLASPQTIDPTTIPLSTRVTWCTNQQASCPLLCTQIGGTNVPTSNTCDSTSLDFSCVCSNGMQPNASQYSQTIPYFECTAFGDQCVTNCNGDSSCAVQCRTANPCGAQNPVRVNLSTVTTSTMTGATAAPSSGASGASASGSNVPADQTGFGGPGGPAATGTSAGTALRLPGAAIFFRAGSGETAGFVAMLVAFTAGFAFLI